MGKVSLWGRWSMVAVGVLLSLAFVCRLVSRLAAYSPVMAAPGDSTWFGSAGVTYPAYIILHPAPSY
jgi:hypothetical protein